MVATPSFGIHRTTKFILNPNVKNLKIFKASTSTTIIRNNVTGMRSLVTTIKNNNNHDSSYKYHEMCFGSQDNNINKFHSHMLSSHRQFSSTTSSFPYSEFPKIKDTLRDNTNRQHRLRAPTERSSMNSNRNYALEKYKQAGLKSLEETTHELIISTRNKPLLGKKEDEDLPKPSQIAEGQRIQVLVEGAIDFLHVKKNDTTFCIKGDPIAIDEVLISKDHKTATVYWSLPLSLLYIPEDVAKEIVKRMQNILIKRGGMIQKLVHGRLRHYYPPKLRYEPSSGSQNFALRQSIQDLFHDVNKKR